MKAPSVTLPVKFQLTIHRFIDPPATRKSGAVSGQLFRLAKSVPVSDTVGIVIKLRNNIIIPQQHAIHGARGYLQFLQRLCIYNLLNELIHYRVFNAAAVGRASLCGRSATVVGAKLGAWRWKEIQTRRYNIKIKIIYPNLILRTVNDAKRSIDTCLFQILYKY